MKTLISSLVFLSMAWGCAAAETYTARLGEKTYSLEEVFYENFSEDLRNWRAEGDAEVRLNSGWLEVDARSGEVGAVTIWCTSEFSGAQLVEYDVRLMDNSIQSNINMFLMASMPEGKGILATSGERNGSYGQYHTFPNYLVTILNAASSEKREMLRVRMRLDPGFKPAEEKWYEPLIFGRIYHVAYLIQPPEVTVFLDGRELARSTYGSVLERGLHGLRIWHTHSIYDNFRVSRLVE